MRPVTRKVPRKLPQSTKTAPCNESIGKVSLRVKLCASFVLGHRKQTTKCISLVALAIRTFRYKCSVHLIPDSFLFDLDFLFYIFIFNKNEKGVI